MKEASDSSAMNRRDCLKAMGAAVVAVSSAGVAAAASGKPFYPAGAFAAAAAKAAYFTLMEKLGYPIPDVLRGEDFWVCDFLQRDFVKLGMGGVFWINEKGNYASTGGGHYQGEFKDRDFGYLGHDIYLLPGQTLPEHRHIGGPEGYGPKMEAWQVRYGEVLFYGEYQRAGDEVLIAELPADRRPWGAGSDWFKSKYAARRTAKSGQLYKLADPESWHGQVAGPEGAIVTEYATYHNHVEFSKPGMAFENSKAA